jgi:hypothetical protein
MGRQGRANGLAARREAGAIAAPLLAGLAPGPGRVLAGGRDQFVELAYSSDRGQQFQAIVGTNSTASWAGFMPIG